MQEESSAAARCARLRRTAVRAFHLADAPVAFDVEAGDGVLYVGDLPTGLYTIRPTW